MLTPKQLAAVAADIAARYAKTSDALTSLMAGFLIESHALDGDLQGALRTSGGLTTRLLHHIADLSPITETLVRKGVVTALSFSAKDDLRSAGRAIAALSTAEQKQLGNTAEAVISQITQLARRDNLAMVEDARRSYIGIVSKYVPQVANGTMSKEQAVSKACEELADRGVCVVDYASGRRDRADVVMRRHITTQIGQTAGQRTMEACERLGIELVEVSSHSGARPSHRRWQGKIYSLHGDKVIDGVKYKDFRTATGYGDIDGLCGVNCRHSFAPYVPGRPKRWSDTPDEDLGLEPEETYKLTQKQRSLERKIRAAKREIACNNATGTDDTNARLKLGRSQKELRDLLKSNKKSLVRDSARERAFDEQGKRVQSHGLTSTTGVAERLIKGKAKGTSVDVNRRAVNGNSYHRKFENLSLPKKTCQSAYREAGRILDDRDGKDSERLVAISRKNGDRILDSFDKQAIKGRVGLTQQEVEKLRKSDGGVVLIHNHPNSGPPSWTDIKTVASNNWIRSSIVACHDGTVWEITCDKPKVVQRFEEIEKILRGQDPMAADSSTIEAQALDIIIEENLEEKWFGMRKVRSS